MIRHVPVLLHQRNIKQIQKGDETMFERAISIMDTQKAQQINPTADKKQTMAMTVNELQTELHISRKTAYALVREPGFPSFHIGERILINRAALQQWMDEKMTLC